MLHSWGKFIWRHPFPIGAAALVFLLLAAAPVIGMRTNMPSITIVPPSANARVGYDQVTNAFGPGAPGTLAGGRARSGAGTGDGHPRPCVRGGRCRPRTNQRRVDPRPGGPDHRTLDTPRLARPSTTCAKCFLPGRSIGGAAAENHDLQQSLASHTPLVLGIFGRTRIPAAPDRPRCAVDRRHGCPASPPSRWPGPSASDGSSSRTGSCPVRSGFQPQGFIDAWAPLFFGAMVFGVAMDYTLFMLSAAKERYETHPDPEHAMIGSMRTSGRVVLSAAAVMVAVFLTFALSGPLAPKEMGVILAIAVALDALVVRLVVLPVVLRLGCTTVGTSRNGSAASCPRCGSRTDLVNIESTEISHEDRGERRATTR